MKANDVARKLSVEVNAILEWSIEFERFLSPLAHSTGAGEDREFSENDMRIFATVAELSNQGWTMAQVEWVIDNAQDRGEAPIFHSTRGVVRRTEYEHAVDIVRRLDSELERLIEERNAALRSRDDYAQMVQDWITVLQDELGKSRERLYTIENEWLPMRTVMLIIVAVAIVAIVVIVLVLVLARPG